ncbi:MAG: hypothetical protein KGO47_00975 [Cyanobacteria bacterium REEB417]|nr:hypothetical protein [Cyanobacteria bacterium REEB417]
MVECDPSAPSSDPLQQRQALLHLLRQQPRGSAQQHNQQVKALIETLEGSRPADLATPGALQQLEGVWELRWSSSRQPYLAAGPWLENLQLLAPSQGRGMNLLRLSGPLGAVAGTVFALLRRSDLRLQALLLPESGQVSRAADP